MKAEQTAVEAATQASSDGGKGKAEDAPRDRSKETSILLEFLYRLAQAYLGSGEQTAQVELLIRRIATAHGMRRVRVVAFPTAIFISVEDGTGERVTLAEGPVSSLRLDQISDIYTLGASVQRKELTPGQGLEQLNRIMRKAPRFGVAGAICGHTILSFGLAMLLLPSLGNILLATLLGTFVGSLKAMRRSNEVLAVPLSVIASFLVSAVVFGLAKYGLPIDPLQSLIPALVTFLPGAMLAMGMVELAYGDMVSGASRLINGFIQLVLLVFGLTAGAFLTGVGPDLLFDVTEAIREVPAVWVPWVGVVVFGLGVHLHFSAPRRALLWTQLVLLATFAAQRSSSGVFGTEFSGFFGALVATPLVYLIQLRFKGPPAMVTFLPSFWLLVPGALSLLSVKRLISDHNAGLEGLYGAVFIFVAIGLGTLMGAALYRWLTETFARWELQIGRAPRRRSPLSAAAVEKAVVEQVAANAQAAAHAQVATHAQVASIPQVAANAQDDTGAANPPPATRPKN